MNCTFTLVHILKFLKLLKDFRILLNTPYMFIDYVINTLSLKHLIQVQKGYFLDLSLRTKVDTLFAVWHFWWKIYISRPKLTYNYKNLTPDDAREEDSTILRNIRIIFDHHILVCVSKFNNIWYILDYCWSSILIFKKD